MVIVYSIAALYYYYIIVQSIEYFETKNDVLGF
jgi:hypothetical protein